MTMVTVSPKFQVVIPKDVRESLGLKAGDRLQAICYRGHVALVPVMSHEQARGMARGIDTAVLREKDRV